MRQPNGDSASMRHQTRRLVCDESIKRVEEWFSTLTAFEALIITAVVINEVPQEEVAEWVGLTPARVSQIVKGLLTDARRFVVGQFNN